MAPPSSCLQLAFFWLRPVFSSSRFLLCKSLSSYLLSAYHVASLTLGAKHNSVITTVPFTSAATPATSKSLHQPPQDSPSCPHVTDGELELGWGSGPSRRAEQKVQRKDGTCRAHSKPQAPQQGRKTAAHRTVVDFTHPSCLLQRGPGDGALESNCPPPHFPSNQPGACARARVPPLSKRRSPEPPRAQDAKGPVRTSDHCLFSPQRSGSQEELA